jgi:ABC-type proline/glycine betaine transport system substrate-binding protein
MHTLLQLAGLLRAHSRKGLTVRMLDRYCRFSPLCMVGTTNRFADAAESGKTAPLRVAYSAITVDQAIPWIALDAGHFEKHGLEVQLIHASSITALHSLLAGEVAVAQSVTVA